MPDLPGFEAGDVVVDQGLSTESLLVKGFPFMKGIQSSLEVGGFGGMLCFDCCCSSLGLGAA